MTISLIIAALLLAANAFFVAAEFALVKLKAYRIDALVNDGSRVARLTQQIHRHLEPYLAACQLGITMASLGLGWVGEPTVAAILEPLLHPLGLSDKLVHSIAFLTGFIVFSSLHIVIGEQVPKTFAIRKPEPVSLWCAYPLRAFFILVYPLNWLLNAASSKLLRLFGVAEASHEEVLSAEEIKILIETSEEHGNIAAEKAAMLHNLFDFDKRRVEEVMVPRVRVAAIDLQDAWEEQEVTLRKIEHSRFPVTDGGDQQVVGILLAKDLFRASLAGETDLKSKLGEMVREPLVVPETLRISLLFEQMRTERQHLAIVVDEYGAFAGIVTLEDLLEEIVGEIADELDLGDEQGGLTERDGYWTTLGRTQLSDIERALHVEFADEIDANTLSGLFMFRLSRVPEVGDTVTEAGYRFRVESMTGRRVRLTKIERAPTDPDIES